MRSSLSIVYGDAEVMVPLPADAPAWSAEQARRWLDEKFVAHECEPVRASGKVLTADKVLAVAGAIGRRGFEQDEALRQAFAHAATAALAKSMVRIDVDAGTVSF
jgi:hypothetical protein